MRAAHIIKVVRVAGAEQHLLTLLPALRARGVESQILLLVEPGNRMQNYVDAAVAKGIPVQRIPIQRHIDPSLYSRLSGALSAFKPDIVHTHLLHADLYGIPAARALRLPVITSRHNDNTFRRRFPLRQVNGLLWRMVQAGIAISDSIARFSIEVEGAPPAKVHRIYYGLDAKPIDRREARASVLKEYNLGAESLLVGVACRLIEQKGVSYALRAFAQVAPEFPDARLLIAGDGPLRKTLENEAKTLGMKDRVLFLGWQPDVTRLLAAFDLLLAPSLWEGFGLVMLEAMAQGTPIIASRVSAIPEVVVDGETGLLVAPRSVPALAAALKRLLADRALRQHMGLVGQDRQETVFSAGRMADETAALYQTLL
jgi:glycosyltransferase involved in cell wall biosynthesis